MAVPYVDSTSLSGHFAVYYNNLLPGVDGGGGIMPRGVLDCAVLLRYEICYSRNINSKEITKDRRHHNE